MKPIKTISGNLLLLLYTLQRKARLSVYTILDFEFSGALPLGEDAIKLAETSELARQLLELTSGSGEDVYNALRYLKEKEFVNYREEAIGGGTHCIRELSVCADGIDIIEGIERGEDEKKEFAVTFNIKVDNTFNVESLIKAELESIFKGSLFS